MDLLFPFAQYWWFYAGFTGFILLLLALDLGVFHRHAHVVTFRESLAWSIVWVTVALLFNYGFYVYAVGKFGPELGERTALEFLTGYVVEKSLAIDNIFVFVLVFAYFGIPLQYQHRVLFYGILGALVFRAGFIALGAVLMQYHAIVLLFGAFLLLTGLKMLWGPEHKIEPEHNPVIRLFRRWMPVAPALHGPRFFVRLKGRWYATPLFVALLFLEMSDIIFAVDSVPAIFAISREPLIVFTSNVFAILGLRAMYFLLAGAIARFHLLKYALALILIFVGLKMVWLNDLFGGKFPIEWSLGIIATLLAAAVVVSLLHRPAAAEETIPRTPPPSSTTQPASGVSPDPLEDTRMATNGTASMTSGRTEHVGGSRRRRHEFMAEESKATSGRCVVGFIPPTFLTSQSPEGYAREVLHALRAEYRALPPGVREQAQRSLLQQHLCLLAAARGLLGRGVMSPRRGAEVQHVLDDTCAFLLMLDVLEPHEPLR